MKKINIKMVNDINPCYCPTKYVRVDCELNIIELLKLKQVPIVDRLWVAFSIGVIPDNLMRQFAIRCAEQCINYIPEKEQLDYINILNIIHQYNIGEQSQDVLHAARDTAWCAAWDAASDAARDAALYAARDAAWCAASDSAWKVAWDTAWCVAWDAVRKKQIKYLIKLLEKNKELL